MPAREPLNRSRILEAACAVADADGLGAVSMRTVAARLGVEAMSLYHHVGNKEAMLDGMVDAVFAEFHQPRVGGDWTEEMRKRSRSARQALKRHPWAVGLMDSRRSAGLETLRHHDAVLGCLRSAGFSVALAAHAFSVLDAYTYGFVLTEVNLPFEPGESTEDFVSSLGGVLDAYPYLAEMVTERVSGRDYAYGDEFDHGLALVLDGLEQWAADELRRRS